MFTGWPRPRSFLQKQQQAWSGSLAGLFLICTCASETEKQACASGCPSLFTLWEQPPLLERVTGPP